MLFRAMAEVGGDEGLEFLRQTLLKTGLFGREQKLADSGYAAQALARIDTTEAFEALADGAHRAARPVRRVCAGIIARLERRKKR